jgi:hypothetical protein
MSPTRVTVLPFAIYRMYTALIYIDNLHLIAGTRIFADCYVVEKSHKERSDISTSLGLEISLYL